MIPYILAAVGGYLIYDSTRKSPNPLSNPYNILADGGEVKKYKDFEDFSMGVSHKKNQVVLIDGKRYIVSNVMGSSSGDRVDLLGIDAENRNDGVRLLVDPSGGILKQEEFAKGGMMAEGGETKDAWGVFYNGKLMFIESSQDEANKSAKMLKSQVDMPFGVSVEKVESEKHAKGGYMAKGGALQHGLKEGDTILYINDNILAVKNEDTNELVLIDIEKGERENAPHIKDSIGLMRYAKRNKMASGGMMADGGMMAKGGKLSIEDKVRLAQIEREIKEQQKTIEEFEEDDDEIEYNRFGDRFGNPSPLSFNQLVVVEAEKNLEKLQEERKNLLKDKKMASGGYMADGGMMAKGGKVKKKWIQEALSGSDNKGALRRTAKRKGLLKGDENLSATDLKKLQKMGGTTAKRAHLAETLRKFEDGGNKV